MIQYLSKWFSFGEDDTPSRDGMNQVQREALIDLLLLAMYSDNHLALAEKEVLEKQVAAFDWRSGTSVEIYVEEATAKVRIADKKEDDRDAFIADLATRLETDDARTFGYDLCKQLFQADADVDMEEVGFLNTLRLSLQP